MPRKYRKSGQNPLCLNCRTEMIPKETSNGTICIEAKSGKPHTCGRYIEGRYRPAREARIYHKARMLALEDDPTQVETPGVKKRGSDVLGALRASERRSGR